MTAASTHTDSSVALTWMVRGRMVVIAMSAEVGRPYGPPVTLLLALTSPRRDLADGPAGGDAAPGLGLVAAGSAAQKKGSFQLWPAPADEVACGGM